MLYLWTFSEIAKGKNQLIENLFLEDNDSCEGLASKWKPCDYDDYDAKNYSDRACKVSTSFLSEFPVKFESASC